MNKCFDDPIGEVPDLDTEQMIEVDRAMIEDYEIELIQMMENAGRNLAHLARGRFLEGNPCGKRVVVLAGRKFAVNQPRLRALESSAAFKAHRQTCVTADARSTLIPVASFRLPR